MQDEQRVARKSEYTLHNAVETMVGLWHITMQSRNLFNMKKKERKKKERKERKKEKKEAACRAGDNSKNSINLI